MGQDGMGWSLCFPQEGEQMGRGCSVLPFTRGEGPARASVSLLVKEREGDWELILICRIVAEVKLGVYKPRSQTGGFQLWADLSRCAEA